MLQRLSFEQYFSSSSFYSYSFLFFSFLFVRPLLLFSHFFSFYFPPISFTVPLFLLRAHCPGTRDVSGTLTKNINSMYTAPDTVHVQPNSVFLPLAGTVEGGGGDIWKQVLCCRNVTLVSVMKFLFFLVMWFWCKSSIYAWNLVIFPSGLFLYHDIYRIFSNLIHTRI